MTQFSDADDIAQGSAELVASPRDALADLPPPDTERWVVRRKQQVIEAVTQGRLSREQACERYRLSDEEYQSWETHLSSHGVRGLRVTRLQDYRRHPVADASTKADPRRRFLERSDA